MGSYRSGWLRDPAPHLEAMGFLQLHVGVVGAHRSAKKTLLLAIELIWWATMKADFGNWTASCLTCLRFRGRPTKQEMGSYKPTHLHPWQEVMIDCEGSSQPPDAYGNKYILTYFCCLCHAVFLEPMKDLTASEVRRAFARCVFRSGTVPWLLRSDRGPEFRSLIMREFVALLGPRHRLGMPWRPTDQSGVERSHQETQKILGILIKDVCASVLSAWTDLLCVVEFVVYNTPGPHGYTPRDIDRRWSLATPLEHDLLPFEVLDFEPISEYASKIFSEYATIRAKVLDHYSKSSAARA